MVIGVAFYLIAQTDAYGVVEIGLICLGGFQFVSAILAMKFNESLKATAALMISLIISNIVQVLATGIANFKSIKVRQWVKDNKKNHEFCLEISTIYDRIDEYYPK